MGHINFNVDAASMSDVIRKLDLVDRVPEKATKALNAGAEIILAEAQNLVHVKTGRLKSALRIGKRGKSRGAYSVEVGAFYPDTSIAHLVEQGHGGPYPAPAYPFLEPAVDNTEDQVINAIMEELTSGL